MGVDPLDDINFRQDAGPAPKEEDKPKNMISITVPFDTIKKIWKRLKERLCLTN